MSTEPKKTERIKRIRDLAREIDYLDRLIKKIPHGIVVDWANDYSTGKPRPITLLGQSDRSEYYSRLGKTIEALCKEIAASEDIIMSCHDPITRTIIRMRYIEGKTLEEVAAEMNYSTSAVNNRSRRFFSKM